jgi:hypothetical protein
MRRTNVRPTLAATSLEDRTTPAVLDLTAHGSSGEINGALFQQYDARPTGTGLIDSFLRIQGASSKNGTQQGYNTDARPLQFDENKSPQFTRSLRAADLPDVDIGGVLYKEFLLDINQKSSQPYLSLDRVQIFTSGDPKLTGYDAAAHTFPGRTPIYDMDAGGDNAVKLDYRLNTGSGSGDMLLYLPSRLFAGEYVTLYSQFGGQYAANAGFQEWARGKGVPLMGNTGGISGSVFLDANENGVRDAGETGFANYLVYLDANGNGQYDPAEGEVHTITDANGYYAFEELATGSMVGYSVRLQVKPTENQTTVDPPLIFLAPGEFRDHVDFGFTFGVPPG